MALEGRLWADTQPVTGMQGTARLTFQGASPTGLVMVELIGPPCADEETLRVVLYRHHPDRQQRAGVVLYDGPLAGSEAVQVVRALERGGPGDGL